MKVTTVLLFALISIFSIHAQNRQSLKEKLKNITGNIKNITIETEKGDFQFEGEEAEKLFNKMKKGEQKIRLEIISDDNDKSSLGKGEKIIVFNNVSDCASDSVNVWFSKTQDKNNKTKDVTIELNDGNKTVTVTTQENGKEKTKVYTGKEAEKYLKGMKKAKFFN